MNISVKYLSQLKTVSALKVLIAFLDMGEKVGGKEIEYGIVEISKDIGVSENSVRCSINELEQLGFIKALPRKTGNSKRTFSIEIQPSKVESSKPESSIVEPSIIESLIVEDSKVEVQEYQKAVGARKKQDKEEVNKDIINNIKNIDLKNINLYTEDINSLSVVNMNAYMTTQELGSLAKRIMTEVYSPRINNRNIPDRVRWYAQQMKAMKDLLVAYRTEQVVAAIIYWTEVQESPNGLTSLYFLRAKFGRGKDPQTNLNKALDYYKTQYLANVAPEKAKEDAELRRVEQLRKERDEAEKQEEERKKVEAMSSEQFVDSYMNRFSHIANKLKKNGEDDAIKK